jgi:hypothetical protein
LTLSSKPSEVDTDVSRNFGSAWMLAVGLLTTVDGLSVASALW